MAMKANTTVNANIDVTVREIDFVTRFATQWNHLREILNILRPIRKESGTKLTSKKAYVALQSGTVAEGDEIPFSKAAVEEVEYGSITIKKYAKAVSIEAIDGKGYENAIQRTDTEFLNELQTGHLEFAVQSVDLAPRVFGETDLLDREAPEVQQPVGSAVLMTL